MSRVLRLRRLAKMLNEISRVANPVVRAENRDGRECLVLCFVNSFEEPGVASKYTEFLKEFLWWVSGKYDIDVEFNEASNTLYIYLS